MAEGQCNCGAVAFKIDAPLADVFVCHCSICRRYTGSNGIAVVLSEKTAFRWLRGQECIAHWKKPDADWESWFCRICGSPLPGHDDAAYVFTPAGLLASGDENLKVAHHIWVGSKANWDAIGDEGQVHIEGFAG